MPKKKLIDLDEFHIRIGKRQYGRPGFERTPVHVNARAMAASADGRVVSFVLSDSSVDRYGDTIDQKGWKVDNYTANPVVLFGHDAESVDNVVGKMVQIRNEDVGLVGDIEFMEGSINPVAETVFQMVKGGYLNTVSVGFQPIDWSLAKDPSRPGGVDFKRQELLEVSIVPVPANPNCIQLARAAGIDVDRIGLVENAKEKVSPVAKGLYEVSWLAQVLADLDWIEDMVEWEAAAENDGSQVPQMIADAVQQLGQALVAMTAEEVAELLADENSSEGPMDMMELASPTPAQKALIGIVRSFERNGPLPKGHPIRAGKTISSATEQSLRAACTKIKDGYDAIMGMVEPGEPADEPATDPEPDPNEAKAARRRRAAALKLKLMTPNDVRLRAGLDLIGTA